MIFAPRSWPSSPGLATTIRSGRRRSTVAPPCPLACSISDLDDQGVALTAARADRRAAEPAAAPAQLQHQGGDDPRAGGADRVAEGDGAAVDVDDLFIDAQRPDRVDGDGGKGLVDLPEVDVGDLQAGLLQRLAG